ncbi:hypothetical protein J2S43_004523 [Catenuloplanes nepalensis]|uniref:DUF4232 domain-containing protein n=1 Tax=Catenuloplanes nepalensis TaxID=587533 RepID=A0ABT9MYA5_9ACTN|nr:DUF4232 domain-containing protein [Catenuloplanes nepalensis]MDP9796011.1 hypothetical protein [Catenuloplanes nepalensis]
MRSLRVRVAMISAAAPALLLAGCGGGASEAAGASGSAAPEVSAATAAPNPSGPGRCHTADLTVTINETRGGGAAGHHGETLTFTNVSAQACTLEGYPGVSFVTGDEGTQVGADFAREGEPKKVTLKPGDSARSDLLLADPGAAKCKATETRGFRIFPPEETAAIFVSSPQQACEEKDKGVGKVHPLAA